jgi:hypothetical protein
MHVLAVASNIAGDADSVATELCRCKLRICRTAWLAPDVSWYRSIRLAGSTLRCTQPRFVHFVSRSSASHSGSSTSWSAVDVSPRSKAGRSAFMAATRL